MDLKNKRVLVVGLGLSGQAAAALLVKKGARVTVTDERSKKELAPSIRALSKKIHPRLGLSHFPVEKFDLVVTSPGVPWDHTSLKKARRLKIPVWGELELGWRFVKPFQTIAVTGTNGKTTTTSMIGWILKQAKCPVVVGGNIGTPLCALTKKITSKTILVLEVSSYQLEAQQTFHPTVGILLNITPDHLARHKTIGNYAKAKARLFANMTLTDTAVLNRNDAECRRLAPRLRAQKLFFPTPSLRSMASTINLPGEHNIENAMAAARALQAVGLFRSEIVRGLKSFQGVKHRLQFVRDWKGVRYINDSKGTNVDSTVVALKACAKPIYIILGGEHKGAPYTPLAALIKHKVKQVLTIGEAHPQIVKDLDGIVPIVSCQTMEKAVSYAAAVAKRGDTVLLSPACASFDQYKNYEHRGDHFISLVRGLK